MDLSTYAAAKLIDLLRGTTWTPPSAMYLSAHTTDPGTTGANEVGLAVSGTPNPAGSPVEYNRVALALNASGGTRATANTSQLQITMPPNGGPFNVPYLGVWDALTGGNFLFKIPLLGTNILALANDSGETFQTVAPHGLSDGDYVELTAANLGGATVASLGFTEGTIYRVLNPSNSTTVVQLSATAGGSAIAISANGAVVIRKLTQQAFSAANILQAGSGALTVNA